ncbi:hypothetical protein J6TS7_11540 [Paenibacillus dendritiformis]|uniref:hypothetical protein n=1 Tax=Paenibacillus TaxID=44249 RepID=UPI001B23AD3A|nr:hypothetical protein [Paenibacillus dendritiformis]GIO77544.1 hypothetical protein J6TS7_11540 [Paenibacillus dendritiformis]
MTSMMNYPAQTDLDSHEQSAKQLFNKVWEWMEKTDRTPEETDMMIHAAHASRYHWGVVGRELQFARGEWQISRVYAVAGMADASMYHARRCMDICRKFSLGAFDTAYAYEALARAASLMNKAEDADGYKMRAEELARHVDDEDGLKHLIADLQTI